MRKHLLIIFIFPALFSGFICHAKSSLHESGNEYPSEIVSSRISNLNIKAFCQDSLGYMWIATLRGLNRYNGYEFVHYLHDEEDSLSVNSNFIISLFIDSRHRLWIGLQALGVSCYHFESDQFTRYSNPKDIPINTTSFLEDHQKRIWVGTTSGLYCTDTIKNQLTIIPACKDYNINTIWKDKDDQLWIGLSYPAGLAYCKNNQTWEYITLPGNEQVLSMASDQQGIWWLGTHAGIILFDPVTKMTKPLPASFKKNQLLINSRINFLKIINPYTLLIGSESAGIFQYDFFNQTLQRIESEHLKTLGNEQILSGFVDRQDNVWIGSFDRGFTIWKRHLDHFNTDQLLSNYFKDKFVTKIIEDTYHNLWISTRYHGLFCYTSAGHIIRYDKNNSDIFTGNNLLIETIFIDSSNRIWIGFTNEFVMAQITAAGKITIQERKKIDRVVTVLETPDGNIWVGTEGGLFRINPADLKEELLYPSRHITDLCLLSSGKFAFSAYNEGIFIVSPDSSQPQQIKCSNKITQNTISLFEDSRQRIWAGSYGYGAACISEDTVLLYTHDNGLPCNDILSIREDSRGDIWMSTSYGLSKLKASDNLFVNYFSTDGTSGDQYHEKAVLRHSDGRFFYGGNYGLTFFNPLLIQSNPYTPQVHIHDLRILNQRVRPAPKGSVLTKSITFTEQITLSHKHSVVSFDYVAIDFLAPQKLTYAYKMDGFEKDWNYVGNYRRATYSNLRPGKYTFMVKAINGDGMESVRPTTLQILVKPAPWLTWQSLTIFFLLFVSVVYYIFRMWFRIKLSKQMLDIEHSEREREKEIAEMKINFFTNISHELRTPLTLISAPLERLATQLKLDTDNRQIVLTISRNVQRLLLLMNQLLDFRKMENGMLALQVQDTDIIQCIHSNMEAFTFLAKEKQIELVTEHAVAEQRMWIDTDKLEKILHNLLSNALKHTPSKGEVRITTNEINGIEAKTKYSGLFHTDNNYMEITVSDTGTGIPADKIDDLFVRYRQIESSSGRRPDYGGSGIGLNYTKRLIETHKGHIIASIRPEGGMAFSFILPLGDVYKENELYTYSKNIDANDDNRDSEEEYENAGSPGKKQNYTILIAEDNMELMAFLRNILKKNYRLLEATDGKEALDIVMKEAPDLILSDVLMPKMNGYQLCAQVKQHPELSHIMVILLTAKTTMDDQLEGLEQGANAYICKPFNVDYLLLTIQNLLFSRDKLRQYYSTPRIKKSTPPIPVNLHTLDQKFMEKLILTLENELSNPNLNIHYIAKEMGFSRASLYRKIKGLTDMSPLDFIRSYRLRRAAEMITEGNRTLSEIADKTGFGTYSYFSAIFKKHFGVSPKNYVHH